MTNKTKRIIGNAMLVLPLLVFLGSIIYYLGWKDGGLFIIVVLAVSIYSYLATTLSSTPKDL